MVFRVLLGIVFIALPFNDLPYFRTVFGELAGEGAFYPLLLMLLLAPIALLTKTLRFPRAKSFYILVAFIFLLIVSAMVNLPHMLTASLAGRTGLSKFFLQIILVIFSFCVAIVIYNLARYNIVTLIVFRKFILYSFILAGSYSIFEIFFHLDNPLAQVLLEFINPLIHTEEEGIFYYNRIRSVCGEPSWFGMYAAFIFPWIAIGLLGERNLTAHIVLVSYFLILVMLSGSRTAYGLIFLQCALLFFVAARLAQRISFFRASLYLVIILLSVAIGKFGTSLISESPEQLLASVGMAASLADVEENVSNITRFGMQITALRMSLDYPVFGVGLGQYAFHFHNYLPGWAMVSYEIQWYLIGGAAAAPVHGLFSRIAAEGGWPALALWLIFWVYLLGEVWRSIKRAYVARGQVDWLGVALLVSLVGTCLTALNTDSFRFPGYWLGIGLAWAYCTNSHETAASREADTSAIPA